MAGPERASALQVVQLGVEATPGTAVAANRYLSAITSAQLTPKPAIDVSKLSIGGRFPTFAVQGFEFSELALGGQLDYSQIAYLLAGLVSATPTGPDAQSGYTWAFSDAQSSQGTPKTYTIQYGSADRAEQIAYGLVTDLAISIDNKNKSDWTAKVLGQAMTDGLSLTASPTTPELVVANPIDWKVYLDTTPAAIGTTQLTRAFALDWGITGHWAQVFGLGQRGPVSHVAPAPKGKVDLTLEADAAGMGFLTQMRAGQTVYLRAQATGPAIGTEFYLATLDVACKIDTVGALAPDGDVLAVKYSATPTYDATLAKAWSITLVDKLTSL